MTEVIVYLMEQLACLGVYFLILAFISIPLLMLFFFIKYSNDDKEKRAANAEDNT